jgi:hypothetical protein
MFHDTHMHKWHPPVRSHCVTGTWAAAAGQVANVIVWKKTANAETSTISIPITVPQNDGQEKGAYLVSVDVYFQILTAACTTLTAYIYRSVLPADTVAFGTAEALTFTYDTNHATAGNRVLVDEHTMTLTLTTPVWVEDDHVIQVQLTNVAGAGGGVFDFIGMRANYTYRL